MDTGYIVKGLNLVPQFIRTCLEFVFRGMKRMKINTSKPNIERYKTLVEKMNAFEKHLIAQELARTGGNVKITYLALGLPRKTFYDKMNKHGLKRKDFKPPRKFSDNEATFPR